MHCVRQGEALALREAPALCGDQTGSTDTILVTAGLDLDRSLAIMKLGQ